MLYASIMIESLSNTRLSDLICDLSFRSLTSTYNIFLSVIKNVITDTLMQ